MGPERPRGLVILGPERLGGLVIVIYRKRKANVVGKLTLGRCLAGKHPSF